MGTGPRSGAPKSTSSFSSSALPTASIAMAAPESAGAAPARLLLRLWLHQQPTCSVRMCRLGAGPQNGQGGGGEHAADQALGVQSPGHRLQLPVRRYPARTAAAAPGPASPPAGTATWRDGPAHPPPRAPSPLFISGTAIPHEGQLAAPQPSGTHRPPPPVAAGPAEPSALCPRCPRHRPSAARLPAPPHTCPIALSHPYDTSRREKARSRNPPCRRPCLCALYLHSRLDCLLRHSYPLLSLLPTAR